MKTKRPNCYGYCGKKAKKGHLFCSQKCAALWAEELCLGNDDVFDFKKGDWIGTNQWGRYDDPETTIKARDWVTKGSK